MNQFMNPLLGGVLIGLAATLLLLFKGKIFGITGILAGLFNKYTSDTYWRIAIVLGLLSGSYFTSIFFPEFFDYQINSSTTKMIIAGFLVGFGTRLGSGCTSGHGVCGLPRFSIRSLIATLTFMGAGILTVYIFGV
jgi:uncharacterized membrane protein YedE/YeeE